MPGTSVAAGETTTAVSTTAATSSTAAATTTTEPPPRVQATGEVWTSADVGPSVAAEWLNGAVAIGDDVWMLGGRENAAFVWRTADGTTWTQVALEPPLDQGMTTLADLVAAPDGRLVGIGAHGTDCQGADPVEDGYVSVGVCKHWNGLVEISADGGATWQRVEPPSMNAGDSSVVLSDLTITASGFAAIGTVKGPDWYGAVWTSADGTSWTLATQLRGSTGPMSGRQLLADAAGTTLVALTDEHPCSTPDWVTPGWVLGATWASHPRLYVGADATSLALQGPDASPVAATPVDIDCATADEMELPGAPAQVGAVVGGTIVVALEAANADGASSIDWTIARLVDGAWQVVPAIPATAGTDAGTSGTYGAAVLFDAGGQIGLLDQAEDPVTSALATWRIRTFDTAAADASGWTTVVQTSRPVYSGAPVAAVALDPAAMGAPAEAVDASTLDVGVVVAGTRTVGGQTALTSWASRPTSEDETLVPVCTLVPGADCFAADLILVDDRVGDLAGVDLSGADLQYATLAGGTFDGARFAGADLSGAIGVAATFVGADFTGAILRDSTMGDLAGAVLTGVDARGAYLELSAPAQFDGANLANAMVTRPTFMGEGVAPTVELSLAGADLTAATVSGADILAGGMIHLTDLRGAVLIGTYLDGVDLRGTALDGVDLSMATFGDLSLCPDGLPPHGPYHASCA